MADSSDDELKTKKKKGSKSPKTSRKTSKDGETKKKKGITKLFGGGKSSSSSSSSSSSDAAAATTNATAAPPPPSDSPHAASAPPAAAGKTVTVVSPKVSPKSGGLKKKNALTGYGNSSGGGSPKNSPKGNNRKKKGGIQFRGRESIQQVQRISRLSTYSPDEIFAVWGDSDEFKLRKDELRKSAIEMVQGKRTSDIDFTRLGLEDKVGEGKKLKNYIRKKARNAVLDEQEYQAQEGAVDPEILADIYYETALPADIRARNKALQIHNEVEHYKDGVGSDDSADELSDEDLGAFGGVDGS